jgi:hypothetical protein
MMHVLVLLRKKKYLLGFLRPKSSSGQGGYSTVFRRLGLSLRERDCATGHFHYWYVDSGTDFTALQTALMKKCKENPNYAELALVGFYIVPLRFEMSSVFTLFAEGNR